MSVYRTDTKIYSIPEYSAFLDKEAEKYNAQWMKDATAFKYQITLQVSSFVIAECPAGIFVNILYVKKKDAVKAYTTLHAMFKNANGTLHILLSKIDQLYTKKKIIPDKSKTIESELVNARS